LITLVEFLVMSFDFLVHYVDSKLLCFGDHNGFSKESALCLYF